MTTKEMLYAGGGVVVLGALAMYAIRRSNGGGYSQVPAAVQALGVPTQPIPSIAPPPINVADTPYFQTFNFPAQRQPSPTPPDTACPCRDKCSSGLGIGPVLSPARVGIWSSNIARSVSSVVQTPNTVSQFPPSQFPWLYTGQFGH